MLTSARTNTRRLGLLLVLASAFALQLLGVAGASAAPVWSLSSTSDTTAAPGGTVEFLVSARNFGDVPVHHGDSYTLRVTLPDGLRGVSYASHFSTPTDFFDCGDITDETVITCTASAFTQRYDGQFITIVASVAPDASGVRTARFTIEGGGAVAPASTVDAVTITPDPPTFGIDAFDANVADATGAPLTQAAAHADNVSVSIDFNTFTDPNPVVGRLRTVESTKDVVVDLPPGFVGNPTTTAGCTIPQLTNVNSDDLPAALCPTSSQVGTVLLRHSGVSPDPALFGPTELGPVPLYNMVPPPNVAARFAFVAARVLVVLDASPRTDGDYGITTRVSNVSQGLAIVSSRLTFWGVPSASSHDEERACPDSFLPFNGGPTCNSRGEVIGAAGVEPSPPGARPFFRNPTSCSGADVGLPTTAHVDSWENPGAFVGRTFLSHFLPGYPLDPSEWGPPAGTVGCGKVPFNPSVSVQTTTPNADAPSGLDFHLSVPQNCWAHQEEICQSDFRDVEVTLPRGMTLNPSAAAGLGSCSESQIGYRPGSSAPFAFSDAPAACPDSSKIGTVSIATPLLGSFDADGNPVRDTEGNPVPDPLTGSVYLAKQGENPAGSLLGMYLVAAGHGVVVKQFGEIQIGPDGRLTSVFHETPQTPVSDLEVSLFGGQRAALRTPPSCGTFAVQAKLTPWSGNAAVNRAGAFEVEQGCGAGGFDPKLAAGTQNPLAGQTSPFSLRITRGDGEQELGGLTATLPPGLSGYLKGIPYCSDAALAAVSGDLGAGAGQEASPSCPAASQVGTVAVGAGAGIEPFYTSAGRAYLAGPYKGAPLSLAVVAPAVAGPFDLGSVVVRNALRLDPETAQITVASDPIPHVLHGIPLDLRDVRVNVNRDRFTLNPTSCEEMQIASTITSTQGASAHPSQRFQVAGCDKLGFKPKLSLRLKGATKRGGHPALTAILTARPGDANLASVVTAFPHSEFLENAHIRTICTRVQYAAGGGNGEQCPKGSIYGHVSATSPIVDYTLEGNVYLRSSSHELPDLVLALHGPPSQPVAIDAVGRIDSKNGGIRNTFEMLPDVPVTKVVLTMAGGNKGLLVNSTNLCRNPQRVRDTFTAQNGKTYGTNPVMKASCGAKKHHKRSK